MTGHAGVNSGQELGRSSLTWDADRGYVDVVVQLLKSPKLNLDTIDLEASKYQQKPLYLAAARDHESISRLLFAHTQVHEQSHLIVGAALTGGNIRILQAILDKIPHALDLYQLHEEVTPIITVVQKGTKQMLRYLLSCNDIDVSNVSEDGGTALLAAVQSGDVRKVKAIMEHPDLDVNLPVIYNGRPARAMLNFAAWKVSCGREILQLLVAHPDMNANCPGDECELTAFAAAAGANNAELLNLLLARKDMDRLPIDTLNFTPLMCAAGSGPKDTLNILLTVPETLTE
ncbi:ankyrin repeat-containing domain protein [Aspergillus varians]